MLDTIRIATPQDAGAIAALVNAAYRPHAASSGWTHEAMLVEGQRTDASQIEALIERTDGVLLVGRHCDTTIACVDLRHSDERVTIGLLAVKPELQNSGLGKTMLTHAETCAVHLFNPRQLIMQVIEERTELLAFYTRRGYTPSGKTLAYPANAGVGQPKTELRIVELHKRPDIEPIEG
jgi:ribosomal protein S18 acetylase RimI-like enzyme